MPPRAKNGPLRLPSTAAAWPLMIIVTAGGDQLKRVRLFVTVSAEDAPPGASPATLAVEEQGTGYTVRKATRFLAKG